VLIFTSSSMPLDIEWTQLLDQQQVRQIPNSPEEIGAGVDEMMRRY